MIAKYPVTFMRGSENNDKYKILQQTVKKIRRFKANENSLNRKVVIMN